jgi:hypothetical protein
MTKGVRSTSDNHDYVTLGASAGAPEPPRSSCPRLSGDGQRRLGKRRRCLFQDGDFCISPEKVHPTFPRVFVVVEKRAIFGVSLCPTARGEVSQIGFPNKWRNLTLCVIWRVTWRGSGRSIVRANFVIFILLLTEGPASY